MERNPQIKLPKIPGVDMRPACPRCAEPMSLAQTVPDQRGFDRRIFECSTCGQSDEWVFKPA
jgi:transcription elongation factor Elf1